MILSPKALALALIGAAISIGTVGAVSASGETGGHFTAESDPATIKLTEQGTHFLEYSVPGLTPIVCESAEYSGAPFSGKTKVEIALVGLDKEPCKTKGGGAYGEVLVHFNGCKIVLLIGKKSTQDNTTELECPAGKALEVTHPSCTIKVPGQKGFNGVAYNTVTEGGKHGITANFTVGGGPEMTAHYENGFCVLLGTTHAVAVTGSITMFAVDSKGAITGLTATGSEG